MTALDRPGNRVTMSQVQREEALLVLTHSRRLFDGARRSVYHLKFVHLWLDHADRVVQSEVQSVLI